MTAKKKNACEEDLQNCTGLQNQYTQACLYSFKGEFPPGWGGGGSNIKKVGVLIVLLRGVNFRFWSRLGC